MLSARFGEGRSAEGRSEGERGGRSDGTEGAERVEGTEGTEGVRGVILFVGDRGKEKGREGKGKNGIE